MKILMVYGGPHENGCTREALRQMEEIFQKEEIQSDPFWIGTKAISGCMACGKCREMGQCGINDRVNDFLRLAPDYDGFVFASPVHFSGIAGSMTAFLDRVFYVVSKAELDFFRLKPAATLVSARRAGTTAAIEQLNQFVQYNSMIQITSQYWNMVHGNNPEEVRKDAEGLQIMRTLASNMVYVLKLCEAGKKAGIEMPEQEAKIATNFIRE